MVYCTTQQVKDYRSVDKDVHDDLLTALIERATAIIDKVVGYSFEPITETRYFSSDALIYDAGNNAFDYSQNAWQRSARQLLRLDKPLRSFTPFTNGDATVLDPSKYRLYPLNAMPAWGLTAVGGNHFLFEEDQLVSITGVWGKYTTPPADIVHDCIRLTSFLYVQRSSQVFDVLAEPAAGVVTIPVGLPKDVWLSLKSYRTKRLLF